MTNIVEEALATVHDLKTWPSVFDAVCDGSKPFEWRKDDRGFDVGDVLRLREWDPETEAYSGRTVERVVTYVLRGRFGVPDGYVVLGLSSQFADETTEPTREQIERRIAQLEWLLRGPEPAVGWETDLAVYRMALRTLDAEEKLAAMTKRSDQDLEAITAWNRVATSYKDERDEARAELAAMTERSELAEASLGATNAAVDALRMTVDILETDARAIRDAAMTHAGGFMRAGETAAPAIERMATALREATERAEKLQRHFDAAAPEHNLPALLDLYHARERDATERAEKAERERDEARFDVEAQKVRARAAEERIADAERERDEGRDTLEHARRVARRNLLSVARHRNALMDERDEARAKLADAERRIAELSPPTVPTGDERIDCESSSLLLLSTWARKVMVRPKNRAKGVPSESIRTLLWMARDELFEAYSAIEEDAPTDDVLAELGDAAAYIAFAMREVESRRVR